MNTSFLRVSGDMFSRPSSVKHAHEKNSLQIRCCCRQTTQPLSHRGQRTIRIRFPPRCGALNVSRHKNCKDPFGFKKVFKDQGCWGGLFGHKTGPKAGFVRDKPWASFTQEKTNCLTSFCCTYNFPLQVMSEPCCTEKGVPKNKGHRLENVLAKLGSM